MTDKSKILICVSNSDTSSCAIKFACQKAKKNDCLLEVATVIDTSEKGFGLFSGVDKVMLEEKREETERYTGEVAAEICEKTGIIPAINIREGFIGEEIERMLKKDDSISLIVIGASEKSSSRGKLVADLADHIATNAFIPLIIIPNNLTDEEITNIA